MCHGFLLGDDDHEVDVTAIATLENGRLGRRRLGVAAGLPVHEHPGVEPVGVGQFGVDGETVVHPDVDELSLTGGLALDQGQDRGP